MQTCVRWYTATPFVEHTLRTANFRHLCESTQAPQTAKCPPPAVTAYLQRPPPQRTIRCRWWRMPRAGLGNSTSTTFRPAAAPFPLTNRWQPPRNRPPPSRRCTFCVPGPATSSKPEKPLIFAPWARLDGQELYVNASRLQDRPPCPPLHRCIGTGSAGPVSVCGWGVQMRHRPGDKVAEADLPGSGSPPQALVAGGGGGGAGGGRRAPSGGFDVESVLRRGNGWKHCSPFRSRHFCGDFHLTTEKCVSLRDVGKV